MSDDPTGEYAILKYRNVGVNTDPTLGQLIDACDEATPESLGRIATLIVESFLVPHWAEVRIAEVTPEAVSRGRSVQAFASTCVTRG
jgi:hypothetical protein